VALSALALLTTACGARVAPYLGADAGLGQSGPATGQGATSGAAGTGAPAPAAAQSGGSTVGAATKASSGPAPVNVPTAAGFNFDPRAEAADCPSSAGNTASDTGVSPSQITFGNVSGLTGPLSGSFNQGAEAVQALFSAVNAAGGICGRKLVLMTEDDGQNSSTNASDVGDLISKGVFAFAGSTSDADNGGVPEMVQNNVPDAGFAINCNRTLASTYWSPDGGSCYVENGQYLVNNSAFALAKQAGYLPSRMAFIAYNIAISAQAATQFENVYKQMGGTVCYDDLSLSPASTSLQSDVYNMKNNNCGGVLTTIDVTGNAKLLQAMQQQSYHPGYVTTTFDGYTPSQITDAGQQAAQGLIVDLPFIPLNENQSAVQLYQQELTTYEPGKAPSGFGFLSWESVQMLLYGIIAGGHSPTRAGVIHTMQGLVNWTGGGALGPFTASNKKGPGCSVDVVVQGSSFVRKSPASGLFCGGSWFQVGPAS
jgi:ABC-type branched-subunit amino acid transport system substrate-binding protein